MTIWLWLGFIVLVLALMALDLGLLNRRDHVIRTREALLWTGMWVALSLVFNAAVFFIYRHDWLGVAHQPNPVTGVMERISGQVAAIQFLTGYLIEKSLSLDNIFVIALIFRYFGVPLQYQHRTLFWGIVGALLMRGAMIGAGVVLIKQFSWTIYVFGGFLIMTSIKMLVSPDDEPNVGDSRLVRVLRRLYPVTADFHGHSFFTRIDGRRAMTPLFLVLLIVESSDVIFAVDSIPAIFAVTSDPFIVFTSNIFAILGLRSLYFALAQLLHKFHYLQLSLVIILAYVGVKMILSHHLPIPAWASLCVIGGVLTLGVLGSVLRSKYPPAESEPSEELENDEAAEPMDREKEA